MNIIRAGKVRDPHNTATCTWKCACMLNAVICINMYSPTAASSEQHPPTPPRFSYGGSQTPPPPPPPHPAFHMAGLKPPPPPPPPTFGKSCIRPCLEINKDLPLTPLLFYMYQYTNMLNFAAKNVAECCLNNGQSLLRT